MRILEYTHDGEISDIKYILRNKLKVSAALLKKLKYSNGIILNNKAAKTSDKLAAGDSLKLIFPYVKSEIEPIESPCKILYEDDDVICFEKDRGVPSHPSQNHHKDTLVNFALFYLEKTNDEFHIVTRLDSLTSGIVLGAKNQYSASVMCTKEYSQSIGKKYIGICRGRFEKKEGIVEAPISRCDDSVIKRCVADNGKYAKTGYIVEREKNGKSLVSFELYTGRTHQIRVHMSHINHPLLNDFLYDENADVSEKFSLHCKELTFLHPFSDKLITVCSDLPEYFIL